MPLFYKASLSKRLPGKSAAKLSLVYYYQSCSPRAGIRNSKMRHKPGSAPAPVGMGSGEGISRGGQSERRMALACWQRGASARMLKPCVGTYRQRETKIGWWLL